MNATHKHLVLAVLLVVLTVVSAPLIPQNQQVDVLAVGAELGEVPSDPQLSLSLPEQSTKLQVSSQSEVLFFDLESEGPYTVRYLTLAVESEGVSLPAKSSDWAVYSAENGRVDYSQKVGYGEQFSNGLLRLRLSSTPAAGYLGEGEDDFALVAPLFKDGATEAMLRLTFPKFLPEEGGWEFVTGHHQEPWMDLAKESILKTEAVLDLPSESIVKR